jgi:uncharacterized protein (TIGR03083 family)
MIYVDWLEVENRAFADAAGRDLAAPVPTCPGWDVEDLVLHHASFQQWITDLIINRAQEGRAPTDARPPTGASVIEWYESIGAKLVAALRDTDPDTPIWGVTRDQTARGWARRQASETSVHRWDAQNATDSARPIEHAVDYLEEMFIELLPHLTDYFGNVAPNGSIELRGLDHERALTATSTTDGIGFGLSESPADVTLTGNTSDLFLALWNRPGDVDVVGDTNVLQQWRRAIAG